MAGCVDFEDNNNSNNGGGSGTSVDTTIKIKNNTGISIASIWIKPSNSTDWGSDLSGIIYVPDGQTRDITITRPLSANSFYDIRIREHISGSRYFIKHRVPITNGITFTFSISDFFDGSNHPIITVRNYVGVEFKDCYIKPSSSEDWGINFGSVGKDYFKSFTIPIPLSSYSTFDIKTSSTSPTNTYTKKNVTITNGSEITFTRADADNPPTGAPVIAIQNNTGFSIRGIWIKPSNSSDWGANFLTYSYWTDGWTGTFILPLPVSTYYDIRLRENASSGYTFLKNNIAILDGMILVFNTSDLE